MTDDNSQYRNDIGRTENGIEITVEARYGDTIEGWVESREDLGLNKHGDPVAGVELVREEPHYRNEDDEYPRGHGPVTLRFPDLDALERARDHLYDKATERFEWGADGEAVQKFVGLLPTRYDVEQCLQTATDGAQNDE
jgi:hypothetical protein